VDAKELTSLVDVVFATQGAFARKKTYDLSDNAARTFTLTLKPLEFKMISLVNVDAAR